MTAIVEITQLLDCVVQATAGCVELSLDTVRGRGAQLRLGATQWPADHPRATENTSWELPSDHPLRWSTRDNGVIRYVSDYDRAELLEQLRRLSEHGFTLVLAESCDLGDQVVLSVAQRRDDGSWTNRLVEIQPV